MSQLPPPGMYIDPEDPSRQRFWNGTAWTTEIDLVPLVHDDRGVPTRALGPEAKAVLDRLVDLSAPLGTKLTVERDRATLALK